MLASLLGATFLWTWLLIGDAAASVAPAATTMAEQSRRNAVGSYILGSQLGRGSFAVVWQGQHRVTGATVAVKEINTNQLNAKLKQSLECEVSILKRVEHRNIVRLQETLEVRRRLLPLPARRSMVCRAG